MATINALASRLSGVAPLSVFFDTIGIAGVSQPPEVNGRREYADFSYTWDFDDIGSGTWVDSGKSKNAAHNYVAGHVFEEAGTYVVTLHVTDWDGVYEFHDVTITVTAADTYYPTTNTVCVSTTGDFAGCPVGATQVTSSAFKTTIDTYKADDTRILFKRGESWSEGSRTVMNSFSGMTIGAYGTGISPDARGIFTNAPVIGFTGSLEGGFDPLNLTDCRFMDLEFQDTSGTNTSAMRGLTGLTTLLFSRLKITGFTTALNIFHSNTTGHDQLSVFNCDITTARTMNLYIGSERLMVQGNYLAESQNSHVCRIWQSYKGVVEHNEMTGASQSNSNGRHALKLHSEDEEIIANPSNINNRTQYTVLANNLFGASNPWCVGIGPTDSGQDERVQDLVIENNRVYAGRGTLSPTSAAYQVGIKLWARYCTVRNNAFVAEDSANTTYTGIQVKQRGFEPAPVGNRLYNNTFYKPESGGSSYIGVEITTEAVDTIAINNLAVFPLDATIREVVVDNSTSSTLATNRLTNDATLIDPTNVVYLDKDFRLDTGSNAIDAGTYLPIFRDFDDAPRYVGSAIDQGAFEFGTDVVAPVLSLPTASETGATTAAGTATTDEAKGILHYLATENATETAATIKAGSSQSVIGTGVQNVSFTGLTAETTYYAHYVQDDPSSNESNVVNSTSFTTEAVPASITDTYKRITNLSTAKETNPPVGYKKAAIIHCSGQAVRWRDDGVAPTASVGMYLPVNQPFVYSGNLHALQFIEVVAGATVDIKYEE